jgi:hypothetical protein
MRRAVYPTVRPPLTPALSPRGEGDLVRHLRKWIEKLSDWSRIRPTVATALGKFAKTFIA